MTKDERQEITLQKIIKANYIGGIEAVTGYGKTRCALNIFKSYKPKSLLIVVPTLKLKEDWIKHLESNNLIADVLVINTASKYIGEYDMLCVDEVHRAASDTWIDLFTNIKYNKLIWLTATIERADGRHSLILDKAPIVDTITLEESLKNDWIDPFEVIKIPIELTEEESKRLSKLNENYNELKKSLGRNPLKSADFYVKYLDIRKWVVGKRTGKVFFIKKLEEEIGKEKLKIIFDKYFQKSTKDHIYHKKALIAVKFYNIVAERKNLLYNAKNKLSKSLELIEQYKDQYKFIFSQRIEFLEELSKLLPQDEHKLYHSKMKKKDKVESFDWFNDGRTKCKTLLSVKSLIEGIDIPKLSVSIITSFTSSKIDRIQSWGRTLRKYKDKRAVIIYLYVPQTQEEIWLNNALK